MDCTIVSFQKNNQPASRALRQSALPVALRTPILRFLALFVLSFRPSLLLRRSPGLRSIALPRPLLLALACPLLRLPALLLGWRRRTALLRSGLRRGWFLRLRAFPLHRRRTPDILLPWLPILFLGCRASCRRRRHRRGRSRRVVAAPLRRLPFACRRRGRPLHRLLLIVLPHHGLTRLITVFLAAQRLLLLYAGIPGS